jgi:hypothetical protein
MPNTLPGIPVLLHLEDVHSIQFLNNSTTSISPLGNPSIGPPTKTNSLVWLTSASPKASPHTFLESPALNSHQTTLQSSSPSHLKPLSTYQTPVSARIKPIEKLLISSLLNTYNSTFPSNPPLISKKQLISLIN